MTKLKIISIIQFISSFSVYDFMSINAREVIIYTDGACSGNPGPGGWGAILLFDQSKKSICGSHNNTTNNQMELQAVVESLRLLNFSCKVTIYTDSSYVKNGINDWIKKWRINGWKSANNTAIKNIDLWYQINDLIKFHNVTCHWIKAHSGDKYNEEVDLLARSMISQNLETDV